MANAEPHPMPLLYYRRHTSGSSAPRRRRVEGKSRRVGALTGADGPGERPRHRATRSTGPARRWSCSTARRRSGARTSRPQLPLLSKAFQLYLPDARGHGRTRWDARDGFGYDWLVDDLAAFVDALGLETFHLLGFSMGAMTALQFAARFAGPAADAGRRRDHDRSASRAPRSRDGSWTPMRVDARRPRVGARSWRAGTTPARVSGRGGACCRRSPPTSRPAAADAARPPRIDAPAMVVCGDRDPFVPSDHAWGMQRQLPDGRLFVVPDCGHEVMVTRPGLFNEALDRLLPGRPRRRPALAASRLSSPRRAREGDAR